MIACCGLIEMASRSPAAFLRIPKKLQNTATNTWTKPACGGVSGSGGGKESCWGTVE